MPRPKRAHKARAQAIVGEYEKKVRVYEAFAAECGGLIDQILSKSGIRVHSVSFRNKDPDVLREKLSRPDKQYDYLSEITDLAGVRIITHMADEVDAIANVIESEFEIIPEHSVDRRQVLDPDRFGYLSVHYVCRMPGRRTSLPEYSDYQDLLCEIQVRSILQHSWAEIEHDLGYKSPEAIPRSLRRRFSRLAALLETADDEFIRIRNELATYAADVRVDIVREPSTVLLDALSLSAFFDDPVVERLDRSIAEWAGVDRLGEDSPIWIGKYAESLRRLGIDSIDALRRALESREQVIFEQYKRRVPNSSHDDTGTMPRGISLFHLWQVLLAETGDPELFVAESEEAEVHMGDVPLVAANRIIEAINESRSSS